ncbi:MAG: FtsQ-type POTRA domain-containing protein [Clostridiales bacterium]|nr:FtsQ-type POTRA domain-containing protein [Clostridiales bacterium]
MDDNELDRLFGYDGGSEGSGGESDENLQIVDKKEEKPIEGFEIRKAGAPEKKKPVKKPGKKDPAGKEPEEKPAEEDKKPAPEEKEKKEADKEATDAADGEEASIGEPEEKEEGESSESEGSEPEKDKDGEEKEEKPSEPAKEEEKKPKKKRKRFRITKTGVIFFTLLILFITAVMLFLFLPAFRVREVTIDGNIELTDEQVLEEVGLKYNAHLMSGVSGNLIDILSFNYGKTEEKIRNENPYISDITITIRIPSEVLIKVKERRKIAYVSTPDGFIALDRNGTVLELNSGKNTQTVSPIIYGISVESAKLGDRVKVRDENSYKKAIIVLGAILTADNATIGDKFNMFEHTKELRVLPSGYMFLTIYTASGKPVQIKLNKTDKINDYMTRLLYLFNSNAFDQVTIKGTLDMTSDEFIFNPSS